jgi:formylglycine-generating enzyme required for sulfatase activity
MIGNVWEWVEDCYNETYAGAPSDGSAWTSGDCSLRVLRGGSAYYAEGRRSASRLRLTLTNRGSNAGFRVARTL